MLFTKEHYELMQEFEKSFRSKRLDREQNKEFWKIGQVYENGEVNELFKAFRIGYTLGRYTEKLDQITRRFGCSMPNSNSDQL